MQVHIEMNVKCGTYGGERQEAILYDMPSIQCKTAYCIAVLLLWHIAIAINTHSHASHCALCITM